MSNEVPIEKLNEMLNICGRGVCRIDTATDVEGAGALYELLPGVHTLMTSHHVIPSTDMAEVTCFICSRMFYTLFFCKNNFNDSNTLNAIRQIYRMKFTFKSLGELCIHPDDVEVVHTSPEEELNVTIVLLRKACVDALKQRGANFFAVRAPRQQHELKALLQYPKNVWSYNISKKIAEFKEDYGNDLKALPLILRIFLTCNIMLNSWGVLSNIILLRGCRND